MAKDSAKDKVFAELKDDKSVQLSVGDAVAWFLNSGHYVLNWVLSGRYDGGWPSGTVNELFGDPMTGKSLIIVKAMERLQKRDILVMDKTRVDPASTFNILDDTEAAYHRSFCEMNGLDPDDLIKLLGLSGKTKTIERHFEQMQEKVNKIRGITKKSPIAVFCDSISQLSTDTEVEGGMEKEDMGRKAKKVHQAMRLYSSFVETYALLYLLSSHVTESMNPYGAKRKVKGGAGLAFQSTVRCDLKWLKQFVRNEVETRDLGKRGEVFGARTLITAVKNRVVPPFRFAIMDVYYDRGLDPYSGLLDHLIRQGRVAPKVAEKKKDKKEEKKQSYREKEKEEQKAKKSKVWLLDGKTPFLEEELESLVISDDVLGIKKAGKEYLPPIRAIGEVSQEEALEDEAPEVPDLPPIPPPPGAGLRVAMEE